MTPTEIIRDIQSRGDCVFVDVVKFYHKRDYLNASNCHTDSLGMGEYIIDAQDLLLIPDKIREYSIHELTRDEYAQNVLANSTISIDDIWDTDEIATKSLVVRILLEANDE